MTSTFNKTLFTVGGFALASLVASQASAHIDLLLPEARAHGNMAAGLDADPDETADQKSAPCGQIANGRTDTVATYQAGDVIDIELREENDHASYFRVWLMFGDGDIPERADDEQVDSTSESSLEALEIEEDLDAPGDADGRLLGVFQDIETVDGTVHEFSVSIPDDVECDDCTLQVLQFMYDTPRPYYYQCADLTITAADGAMATGTAGAGMGGAGGMGMGGAGGMGMGGSAGMGMGMDSDDGGDDDDEGCSVGVPGKQGISSSGLAALMALGLGVCLRRRRK